MGQTTVQDCIGKVVDELGWAKRGVSTHTLRHCYATHQLERGVNLRTLQVVLGHARIQTTLGYLRVLPEHVAGLKSPFDVLGTPEGDLLR